MRRALWPVAAALIAMALAPGAHAQQTEGFNANNFKPGVDPFGYGMVNGARSLEMKQFHLAVFHDWQNRPLNLRTNEAGVQADELLREVNTLHLTAGIGVFKIGNYGGIQIGAVLPIVLDNFGVRADVPARDFQAEGLGDLRTDIKVTVLDRTEDAVGLGFRLFSEWPTGDGKDLRSENERWSPGGTLIIEKKIGMFRIGAEGGWQHFYGDFQVAGVGRSQAAGGKFRVDDKLRLGAGIALDPTEWLSVFGEIHHWTRAEKPWDHAEEAPTEIAGGVKLMTTIFGMLGVSSGLHDAIGAPEVRIFGALGLTF